MFFVLLGGTTWDETMWEFDAASGLNTAQQYADSSRGRMLAGRHAAERAHGLFVDLIPFTAYSVRLLRQGLVRARHWLGVQPVYLRKTVAK